MNEDYASGLPHDPARGSVWRHVGADVQQRVDFWRVPLCTRLPYRPLAGQTMVGTERP